MRSGFTFIELVIGVAISTSLSLLLYRSLNDATAVNMRINSFVDIDDQLGIFYNQIDKDISSAFSPEASLGLKTTGTAQDAKQTSTLKTDQQLTTTGQDAKAYKIEKVFFAENENENLKTLSFINTNPLRGYDEVVPLIVRIVYRLIPDKDNAGMFKLYRQQSSKLDAEVLNDREMKKVIGYEIASNLKSLKAQFIFKSKKEGEQETETTRVKDWQYSENLQKYKRPLPEYVELEGEIQDVAQKRTNTFKFVLPIFAKFQEPKPEQKPTIARAPQGSFMLTGTSQ